MLNYTRGNWQIAGEAKDFVYCLNSNGINRFSLLVQGGYTENAKTSRHEIEENAQLIASAPDMYEALKLLQAALTEYRLRDVKKRFSLCAADAAASKAIAKAEGKC